MMMMMMIVKVIVIVNSPVALFIVFLQDVSNKRICHGDIKHQPLSPTHFFTSCKSVGSRNCGGGQLIPCSGVLLSTSNRTALNEVPTRK
jgi:hypothetical protein